MIEGFRLLEKYGIKTVRTEIARSADEAKAIARQIGYPVAVKVNTFEPVHKTELGLVRLNVNEEQLESIYYEIIDSAVRANIRFDGIIIQQMAKPGLEIIVGLKQDPQFGPIVLFGLGGIYTEILRDFAIRVCPISEIDAIEMVEELKAKEVFTARGITYNKRAITDIILKVNEIAMKEKISELDLNPIFVYPEKVAEGYVVVDVRVIKK